MSNYGIWRNFKSRWNSQIILGNEFKKGNEMCKKLNGIKKTFIFNYYMYDFI